MEQEEICNRYSKGILAILRFPVILAGGEEHTPCWFGLIFTKSDRSQGKNGYVLCIH